MNSHAASRGDAERFDRWRLVCQWWPIPYVLLFMTAALDPNPVYPALDTWYWDTCWFLAAAGSVAMISAPVEALPRYMATTAAVAAMSGRAATLLLTVSPTPWLAVASWSAMAVSFAVTAALSWWIAVHAPRGSNGRG